MGQIIDYLSEKYQHETSDEVNRKLLELSSLFEISQLINESLELGRVLNNVLLIPMGRLMIPRCAILLKHNDEKKYRIVMAKGISEELKKHTFSPEIISDICSDIRVFNSNNGHQLSEFDEFVKSGSFKISVPFIFDNRPLGLMLFSEKLNKTEFNSDEIEFLKSLANLSASTVNNALQLDEIKQINTQLDEKNKQLDEKIQELNALFDISQGLSSATLDYQKILRLLAFALMGQMRTTKYAILLKKEAHFESYEAKGYNDDIIDKICQELPNLSPAPSAVLVSDVDNKTLLKVLQKNEVEVVVPMQHQDKVLGFLILGPKFTRQSYEKADLEFLTTLISQAVISLENARLFEETLEKQRLEEELNVARTIQKKLLPKSIPEIAGYDVYGMNDSSKQVGGDYFDIIPIDEERVAMAIGDVSGKGIPASLLMANLQAALRVMMTPDLNLAAVVGKLNDLIHANTGLDKFITFFIGILNIKEHTMEYVNAGHNNPVHYTAKSEMNFLDIGGIILGIMPNYAYNTGKISLEKGDAVVTYTDGVNEAIDPDGEEWGEEPLYDLIKAADPEKPVKELVDTVLTAIDDFAAGEPQADDVTMLVFRRLD